ncbi:sigma-70 family RNA polymerase sigma factor [Pseudoalteromonas rubra]|uniref:sigma-70 family RNA polymerase sigma factor n=1 Tax=Pseudoalteromonas rubra TaxID=43658 RepID=UPI000F776CB4|nr:sigma-70 family RNA polymerase sigma factor [Pseudoalteromonas rubra]
MNSIKEVRKALRTWGRYWASKECTDGYARKSNTERIRENHMLGGLFSSDAHLFSHGSNGINPPDHIKNITDRIDRLSKECKQVLIATYIKQLDKKAAANWVGMPEVKSVEFWLLRAEKELLT